MIFQDIPNTEFNVSRIAFGAWAVIGGMNWGNQDYEDSVAAIHAALDSGINFFDTAEGYGAGSSEELLGKTLSGVRDDVIIASKVSTHNFERNELITACERSLKALNTDRIDIYQLHWPSRDVPLPDTIDVLRELKQSGKIREFAVSNFGVEDMSEFIASGDVPCTNQMAYNLLFRAIEHEILPQNIEHQIGIICYCPIMQGLLSGKFETADDVPEARARTRHFSNEREECRHGGDGYEELTFKTIARIQELADGAGISMADLSIAWLLAQPGVTAAIVGARNADQTKRNVNAVNVELDAELLGALDDATAELKDRMGSNPDLWQEESRIR